MNAARRPNASRFAPPGFTLIELLMVILIVGLLAGLLLVAVNAGLKKAQEARTQTEIDQLTMAIETFKNDRGTYPPTMGGSLLNNDLNRRATRFLRALRIAFPRYQPSGGTPLEQLATVQNDILLGLQHFADVSDYPKMHEDDASIGNMDPAEALVFFLGGMPDPTSETKLIGFRTDPTQPFRYPISSPDRLPDDHLKGRTQPLFPFDPKRLVDRDGDGWWEYIPEGKSSDGDMAPYIYFDNGSYGDYPYYPQTDMKSEVNALHWGHGLPYASDKSQASFKNGNGKVQWLNSKKFQLIAPGRDGGYGNSFNSVVFGGPTVNQVLAETRLWPQCAYLNPASDIFGIALGDRDLDNQTNVTGGSKLGDDRQ